MQSHTRTKVRCKFLVNRMIAIWNRRHERMVICGNVSEFNEPLDASQEAKYPDPDPSGSSKFKWNLYLLNQTLHLILCL